MNDSLSFLFLHLTEREPVNRTSEGGSITEKDCVTGTFLNILITYLK